MQAEAESTAAYRNRARELRILADQIEDLARRNVLLAAAEACENMVDWQPPELPAR